MMTVKVVGTEQVKKRLEILKVGVLGASAKAIRDTAIVASNTAKRMCAVDMGGLRASIGILHFDASEPSATVGTDNVYGPWVEYGTRPHFPPVSHLEEWAQRHGMEGAGYAIALKIAREGTKPQPFMRPAAMEAQDFLEKATKKEVKNAAV